jgi:hypothetical protein
VNGRQWRQLERDAEDRGWTVERTGSGHVKWTSPGGQAVSTACSPSDPRTVDNDLARLRRAGLDEARRPGRRKRCARPGG